MGIVELVASIITSVALVWYARSQARTMRETEKRQRREREADRMAALDVSYAIVRAEWFRIWSVAKQWRLADLPKIAYEGHLTPTEVLPQDWTTLSQELARLGIESGQLGSMAFVLSKDTANLALRFIDSMSEYIQYRPDAGARRDAYDADHRPRIQKMSEDVKRAAEETANLFEDALNHAPNADQVRMLSYKDTLRSEAARRMKARLESPQELPRREQKKS